MYKPLQIEIYNGMSAGRLTSIELIGKQESLRYEYQVRNKNL